MQFIKKSYQFILKKVWHIVFDDIFPGIAPVDWSHVSWFGNLSEDFILEFSDKVYWDNISHCQSLSKEFIFKNFDKLDVELLLMNDKISKEVKEYIKMLA